MSNQIVETVITRIVVDIGPRRAARTIAFEIIAQKQIVFIRTCHCVNGGPGYLKFSKAAYAMGFLHQTVSPSFIRRIRMAFGKKVP